MIYKLLTGPFEGMLIDDLGHWMERLGCENYQDADEDLQFRAREWAKANGKDPVKDWDFYVESWDSEEVDVRDLFEKAKRKYRVMTDGENMGFAHFGVFDQFIIYVDEMDGFSLWHQSEEEILEEYDLELV